MISRRQSSIIINGLTLLFATIVAVPFLITAVNNERSDDTAYVLVNPNTATAQWQYQQLKMDKCRWCGRTLNLNRHHVIPQSANPALRDVRENLIVLCRDCHFVLGHRCNWKQYNPDVMYICTHYTNCIKSADTRGEVERATPTIPNQTNNAWHTTHTEVPDTAPIMHVTNDVPDKQRTALERILNWNKEGTNALPFRPSAVR